MCVTGGKSTFNLIGFTPYGDEVYTLKLLKTVLKTGELGFDYMIPSFFDQCTKHPAQFLYIFDFRCFMILSRSFYKPKT